MIRHLVVALLLPLGVILVAGGVSELDVFTTIIGCAILFIFAVNLQLAPVEQ